MSPRRRRPDPGPPRRHLVTCPYCSKIVAVVDTGPEPGLRWSGACACNNPEYEGPPQELLQKQERPANYRDPFPDAG